MRLNTICAACRADSSEVKPGFWLSAVTTCRWVSNLRRLWRARSSPTSGSGRRCANRRVQRVVTVDDAGCGADVDAEGGGAIGLLLDPGEPRSIEQGHRLRVTGNRGVQGGSQDCDLATERQIKRLHGDICVTGDLSHRGLEVSGVGEQRRRGRENTITGCRGLRGTSNLAPGTRRRGHGSPSERP